MNRADPRRILLVPIDNGDTLLHGRMAQGLEKGFDLPVEIFGAFRGISFAYDPEREQYHSTLILERLDLEMPSDALKILAITEVDLFIPILTYVFGEAQLGGRACIVSTCRLKEGLLERGREVDYHERVVKEGIHEMGHTFGLRHCREPGCIMHYSRSTRDVDQKSPRFCRYCRVLLADARGSGEERGGP